MLKFTTILSHSFYSTRVRIHIHAYMLSHTYTYLSPHTRTHKITIHTRTPYDAHPHPQSALLLEYIIDAIFLVNFILQCFFFSVLDMHTETLIYKRRVCLFEWTNFVCMCSNTCMDLHASMIVFLPFIFCLRFTLRIYLYLFLRLYLRTCAVMS